MEVAGPETYERGGHPKRAAAAARIVDELETAGRGVLIQME